jgi:hypothetical protein
MNASRVIRVFPLFVILAATAINGNLFAGQHDRKTDWSRVQQIPINTSIKVLLKEGFELRGKWISADEVSAIVLVKKAQRSIRRDEVIRICQRMKGNRAKRALLGAAIGAGGGLGSGAILDARSKDTWFPNIGKQVLTPLGAIAGVVIGVALPTGWREIYSQEP